MTAQGELDALVVRHIGDIEGAMAHAVDIVGPRLWEESGSVLVELIGSSEWHVSSDAGDEDIWFAHKEWMASDNDPAGPEASAWFSLAERLGPGGDGENSWLATFVAAGPNGANMALVFRQDILTPHVWKKLVKASETALEKVLKTGMLYDAAKSHFYVPFRLDREALAKAFEDEDFEGAFTPLVDAARLATTAKSQLSTFVELARSKAG